MVYKILSKTALLFLLLTSVLVFVLVHTVVYDTSKKVADIEYIVSKKEVFERVTKEEICDVYECSVLYRDNKSYYYDKDELKRTIYGERYFMSMCHNLYFEPETLSITVKVDDTYVFLQLTAQIREHADLFTFYIPVVLIFFFIFFYRLLKDEMFYAMLHKSSIVNNMEIMTAIKVGENTAHEIRTPLDVTTSKIYKIREAVHGFLIAEREYTKNILTIPLDRIKRNKQLESLEEDFNLLSMALTQIADQVDKMSGYKNLLHSNGNKSLHDIIGFARRSMVMGHDNIEIHIDDNFTKYGVTGLKNSEMLGIFINHFKNSIEATSSRIDVKIISLKENMLTLTIGDNGNGIPDKLKPHIFESGRSSKQKIGASEVIRGHGMFNNKVLLTKLNGNLILDRRYKNGTMFVMTIPIKPKK